MEQAANIISVIKEAKESGETNEAEVVVSFLEAVNNVIRKREGSNPMSERTALKFLISRKFNLQEALQLYSQHEVTRLREGLSTIDPLDENLQNELNSGKFTILSVRDSNDSAIALFTAKLHSPNKSSKNQTLRRKIHRDTLRGIVYQLDSALENILTQRNGIVFIYNMSDSEYSNFDYELCQKILNLLRGAYPAKLKKMLIVSPPLWFRAPFHLLRLIVKEKLRDRVWLLNTNQLKDHIAASSLPTSLGGQHEHNHRAWIEECNVIYKTKLNDLCDPASAQNLSKETSQRSSVAAFRRQSIENLLGFNSNPEDSGLKLSNAMVKSGSAYSNKAFVYDYDEIGMSLSQFVEMIRAERKKGLGDEYESIVSSEKPGTLIVSSNATNMRKNRYTNILCYDHTRVVLEPYDLPEGTNQSDSMDYINASYIDGYRQPKAYISTQGPTQATFMDFWRMIWQTSCRVIVMVTLNIENSVMKCDKYWPSQDDRVMITGVYKIEFMGQEVQEDYISTHLKLTNTRSEVTRDIWHLQFVSWPDFGVPLGATALLKFRESVLKKQLDAIEMAGCSSYPPIVVHCSAGVGRSGTFVTVDICIQKLETTGLADVKGVVEKLRQQRYLSIQTRDQYIFCYKALIEYAESCGLLDEGDIQDLFFY